ncbi:MAG: GTP-binding protein [Candidatus Lokiarchaeota archaeon]|nr:GTP-binding protein [Candidatus Lokiarchaeota archaeon]
MKWLINQLRFIKLVIAGDGGVGKTNLMTVFCGANYIDQAMTIGIYIHSILAKINEEEFYLQIWDFSGQDQFRFLMKSFVQGAFGAILAFDCSRLSSFENLPHWIEILRSENENLPIFLVAMKVDRDYHPLIEKDMIYNIIAKYNLIGFAETSSRKGINVNLPFKKVLEEIYQINHENPNIIFKTKFRIENKNL